MAFGNLCGESEGKEDIPGHVLSLGGLHQRRERYRQEQYWVFDPVGSDLGLCGQSEEELAEPDHERADSEGT
jgi:hypothetical protein